MGTALTRHRPVTLAAALSLLVLTKPTAANPADLAGRWRGSVGDLNVQFVILRSGRFDETVVAAATRTALRGHIVGVSPGVVTFVVDQSAPASSPVSKAASYAEKWVSPNQVILTEITEGNSITLLREP